jgi:hypothetical protein
MASKYTISEVFNKFGASVIANHTLHTDQLKVLRLIGQCRTSQLGSHKERCSSCGHTRVHYNSCGNRHCPNCQGVNKERWILERSYDLLPVPYFHGVFTVPGELRDLFRYNKKLLYNLLFRCVWETLYEFSIDARQKMEAKPGLISILHTWNQKMQYHPHIHCIIPSGGINTEGQWKSSKGKDDFLFSVKAVSSKFKKKFLHYLVVLYKTGQLILPPNNLLWSTPSSFYKTKRLLYDMDWVVYAKETFYGPQQVIEYLGRYTHRIAMSNHRILKVTDTHVTFSYLNRKNKCLEQQRLTGEDFILRFLQHVLPKRFTKIRHYGFLSTRSKKEDLKQIRIALQENAPEKKPKLTTREILIQTTGKDPYLCPKCQQDSMVVIEVIADIRGSPMRGFTNNRQLKLEMFKKNC